MESPVAATSFSAANAENPAFWRTLCPDLVIDGSPAAEPFSFGNVDALIQELKVEGYVNVPDVVPETHVNRLRDCLATLQQHSIPLPFAFVYDEAWQLFAGFAALLGTVLGAEYRALPDFWAWRVIPSDDAAGWWPHRDKNNPVVDSDNTPHSITIWAALSDAVALNGCIYVLPMHRDGCFKKREWDGEDNAEVREPQNIRALPATAGSMLAWNQNLLHWGGRASRLGTVPRSSISMEFQRGDKEPLNRPLLDPQCAPSFHRRLGLIGKQILQYRHMYPLTPDFEAIGEMLRARFLPEATPVTTSRRRNPVLNSSVVLAPVTDGYVAYNYASDDAFELNPAAALIAELCDGTRSADEISAAVAPFLPDGSGTEVARWIEDGLKSGLLTDDGQNPAGNRDLSAPELSNLSERLLGRGKLNLAYLVQRSVMELSPDDAEAWSRLGYLAQMLGHRDQARAAYQQYLALTAV
jgi:hypothetical protein